MNAVPKSPQIIFEQTWSLSDWPLEDEAGVISCCCACGCWVTVATAVAGLPGIKMSCEEMGALRERLTCRMTGKVPQCFVSGGSAS